MNVSTFRGLLFSLFLLISQVALSQEQAEIQVEKQSFNFGLVAEERGPVKHSFHFRNSGNAPLVITRVTADCGCTTPMWPEKEIAPGEESEIQISFDPIGRVGAFIKHIRVFYNSSESPLTLSISGTVTTLGGGQPNAYAMNIGPLQVSNARLLFPVSTPKMQSVTRLVVNNPKESNLKVSILSMPSFVSLTEKDPFYLEKDQPKELNLMLHIDPKTTAGMKQEPLVLEVQSSKSDEKFIDSIAILLPLADDFTTLPSSEIGEMKLQTQINMGKLKEEIGKTAIPIKNTGSGVLRIHSITFRNPALSVETEQTEIPPGESTLLHINVDSNVIRSNGWQSIAADISIICNDPQAPWRRIKVRAEI